MPPQGKPTGHDEKCAPGAKHAENQLVKMKQSAGNDEAEEDQDWVLISFGVQDAASQASKQPAKPTEDPELLEMAANLRKMVACLREKAAEDREMVTDHREMVTDHRETATDRRETTINPRIPPTDVFMTEMEWIEWRDTGKFPPHIERQRSGNKKA